MTVTTRIPLPDETATDALARRCAARARPGDTFLLEGEIGAGKSHFARAFIRARLGAETEVPSPTFTLMQTYGPEEAIWHVDLYRLADTGELVELGLDEALGRAICLIEWPDRLGDLRPRDAAILHFSVSGAGRDLAVDGPATLLQRLGLADA